MDRFLRGRPTAIQFLLAFFLLIFSVKGNAQLTITPGVTANTLITNLVGNSMTVTNVVLTCPTNAYGTFSNGNTTNMGIANGIIMTTGSATNAIGPNNTQSAGTCNNTMLNDPQLTSLDPQATRDPCILEFDIVPQCNSLTINFVFGSEEYPEFVNSGFNDAFGFWITGPGPACQPGFYNNTNVATLPNNTTIVSINNVNGFTNSMYYVPNGGGPTIQYDGFTTVLTRTISLCACQTYHWKIAIADAGDCIYDSGVFIDFLSCSTALTATTISTPASCSGCNGTATANATGTGPFTYSWAPSGGNAATASNLCPGTYTCTVDDAVTCSPPTTVAVTVVSAIVPVTTSASQTNVSCNGGCNGTATANPTSGNGPYVYSWSPSGGSGATESNLCSGTYTATITDANGCTGTASFTITQPVVLSATSVSTNVSCFGGLNGTASATPSGGTSPYFYTWQPSGGNSQNATGLSAGTYTCIIVDINGCATNTSVTITEPPAFTASITVTAISCFGGSNGSATVTTSGGAGGYQYSWSSGGSATVESGLAAGSYTCTVTDANGCTATSSITLTEPNVLALATSGVAPSCFNFCDGQLIVNPTGGTQPFGFLWSTGCTTPVCNTICAGTYSITVTDANGCTANSSVTITQPTALVQNLSSTPSNCIANDGTASTTVNGGTGPYTYSWQPGNGNAALYSNIGTGMYTVTVTDANNCISVDSVFVANTSGLSLSQGTIINASCFASCDGSLTAVVNGTPPYTYSWSPSGGNAATASNLCDGTYTCTITDADGCWNTISFTVTEPTVLGVTTPAAPPVICNGDNTTLSAAGAGATPGYSYSWMPGNLTGNAPVVSPASTTTYTVTVTDANGCTTTGTELITVNPTPVAALSGLPLSGCAPLHVVFADITVVAAPGVITTWLWDFGDGNTSALQHPVHDYLNPGTYPVTVTVTTADGCTSTISLNNYSIVHPDPVAGFTAFPQPTTIFESTVYFTDQSTGASSWQWNFGDLSNSSSSSQNPSFYFPDTGCYHVQQIVISPFACRDTIESIICIEPGSTLYVPNAFTPNGDGVNEVFIPLGTGIDETKFDMWIFDRWGNLIFYTNDLYRGWDGRAKGGSAVAQVDTYVYRIEYTDDMGLAHKYLGKISLLK